MYSRFTAMKSFGEEAQERLEDSKVAVVGLGATGSAAAESLARHGADLVLIDRDYLEEKDVYSSSIYTPRQCRNSLPKAEAAGEFLSEMTGVETHISSLGPSNTGLLGGADLILDGSDNLRTRHLIAEYSLENDVPWVYTAAIAGKGYSMFFSSGCFNCLVGDGAPEVGTCETEGVMREVSSRAGLRSAQSAVEFLAGEEVPEALHVIHTGDRLEVRGAGCEVCEGGERPHLEGEVRTVSVCGQDKYQVDGGKTPDREILRSVADVIAENDHLVRLEYGGREATFFRSGRAIIEARDRGHAEATYSELLGG